MPVRCYSFPVPTIAIILKEKLLAEIPELESIKKGRNILLAFKKYIGAAFSQASIYSEAIILVKTATILPGHMIDHESAFAGTFHDFYQHRVQSCTQTEEALKELHIQHILHEMFQQMRIHGQSCVLARSWQF
jgi:hypothetical protein